jgi:glycosyltransferase involved in cell wall biosynthesis
VPAFSRGAGGAEQVVSTILRHLDRSDLECHLATIQSGMEFLNAIPEDIAIHQLNVSRMRYALAPVVSLVRRLKPHTILTTVSYTNILLLLARPLLPRGTKLIIREATTPSGFLLHETTSPRLWKFFYRRIYPHADRIVCLTGAMQREFHERFHISQKKLVQIYNPVDRSFIHKNSETHPNPYIGEDRNIVAAGRLRREKGFDVLIHAFALVRRQLNRVQLTILGEGPEESALQEQARDLGLSSDVHFPGFQRNPWPYFAHANLFVLPSRLEGMPNALLEALTLGTPVIATECVEGIRELQKLDSRIITTLPENPKALAGEMIAALRQADDRHGREHTGEDNLQVLNPSEIASRYKLLF